MTKDTITRLHTDIRVKLRYVQSQDDMRLSLRVNICCMMVGCLLRDGAIWLGYIKKTTCTLSILGGHWAGAHCH